MAQKNHWSDWQPLPGWNPSSDVLRETLDGGQSFRWTPDAGTTANPAREIWTGTWSTHLVQVRPQPDGLAWRSPLPAAAPALHRYLGLDTDWSAHTDALPWRSDPHLARCLAAFPGLRLLRQPFGETLLGFLCSATKQIVQIKQMLALLAERHGPLVCRAGSPNPAKAAFGDAALQCHQLPTWSHLASIPEKDLRACQLGFRARYIAETAQFLAAHPGWLDETERLPYAAAKTRLIQLPGVGEKVADCVLLFGAGKLEAFPVDTWMLKSLARRYGLDGWKPAQVAHFGRTHFGPIAGLAQQYLFSWERKFGGR
ncbi:hypothetical protein Verru16b_01877 [Lacunisphaera limnophila]|uniref:DNA-(apurinic or apyrimidinic site) lyase n=1 Tax=Lacunisphaera limnophila TaxID=1838286 RepID=A0A1D8AV75_9BACT|nr:DNA glycosylase [Lacunisphaera limnophila]AOS44808.1 hypothetical protein Verru16b_01877 [Lacunisphaera limnophila]